MSNTTKPATEETVDPIDAKKFLASKKAKDAVRAAIAAGAKLEQITDSKIVLSKGKGRAVKIMRNPKDPDKITAKTFAGKLADVFNHIDAYPRKKVTLDTYATVDKAIAAATKKLLSDEPLIAE